VTFWRFRQARRHSVTGDGPTPTRNSGRDEAVNHGSARLRGACLPRCCKGN
jgi:hypothetical protein